MEIDRQLPLFEDSPAARRRLILGLYAVVSPGLLGAMLVLRDQQAGYGPVVLVAATLLAGALWVYARRNPSTADWIFPVSVGPTICVGVAYATSGPAGDAFLPLMGAPLACAAVLFERPVVLAALATVIPAVIVALSIQVTRTATVVGSLLLGPAAAIAGWVIHSSATQFRATRRELQRRAQRDEALLRSLPDVLARADGEGRVLDIHVPSSEGVGKTRHDLVGRLIHDFVPPEAAGPMREALARALEKDCPQRFEYAHRGPGGERFYETTVVRSGPDEVTVIRRDVSERRRADDERRFSSALLGRMQEAVIAVDLDLRVVKWTGGAERIYGWSEAEVLGRRLLPLVQPGLSAADVMAFEASLAWKGTEQVVVRQKRKDGTAIVVDSNVAALHDAEGNVQGYLAVCRDVTVQHAAESSLRESEARLRAYFETPAVGVSLSSPEKGWIEVNDQLCQMLGYSRDELTKMRWLDATHPDDAPANMVLFDRLMAGECDRYSLDKRFIRKDGTTFWALVSASCVRRADGSVRYVVAIYIDIDKRKQAEDALRQSERWLSLSQDIARIGHYVYDIQQDHWSTSAALDSIFGIDASYPRKAADWAWLIHPEDREMMRMYLSDLLSSGTRFDKEYRVVHQATGEARWVHGLGELQRGPGLEPVRLVGTIQDVNTRHAAEVERGALQKKLALSARLAAMGTLVAGVAHEINNPLAAEMASQGLALEAAHEARKNLRASAPLDREAEASLLDEVIETLQDAQSAAERISQLIKDFAAFGRPNPPRTRVRLQDTIEQALAWLPRTVFEAADVRVEDLGAPDVLASNSQIEQVIINLVSNAARATSVGQKGNIVVRLGRTPAGMASLEVIDQGIGIPSENLDRIFEPFFTTRPVGDRRGLGIGLAISHSIVEAHEGRLSVTSEVGKGSTFRVELPAAPAGA